MHCHLHWFLWLSAFAEAWATTPLIPSMFAQEGTSVVLPCNASKERLRGNWRICVRWSRDRRTMLLVEQNGVVKRGRLMVHRATIREALFQKGVFSLHIQPVQYTDAGLYTASVQYGEFHLQCEVLLHVTKVTAVPHGTVPETGSVSLTCASTDSQKEKEVRWYHNENPISSNKIHMVYGRKLSITQLSVQHSGDWRCELLYDNGRKGSALYHLQVLGFSHGDLNPSFVHAAVSSSTQLPCHLSEAIKNSTQDLSVRWSRIQNNGHEQTLSTSDQVIQGLNSWSRHGFVLQRLNQNFLLNIPNVGESDAGIYRCSFTYHSRTLTRNVTLVTMRVSSSVSGLIQEGSRLQLTCDLSDPTEVQQYEWSKLEPLMKNESEDEETSDRSRKTHKGRILELAAVSLQDAGTWVCSVYAQDRIIGQVTYPLDVTGAQNASRSPISSGEISFAVIFFLVLLILVVIFILAWRNRRRRLSHYPALENVGRPAPEKCLKAGADQEAI